MTCSSVGASGDTAQDEAGAQAMMETERRFKVRSKLERAMKMGRLYGTGLLVMVTREAPLDAPLRIEQMRPGDLVGLRPFHRYDASVFTRAEDLYSEDDTYGEALSYWMTPTYGPGFHVTPAVCCASTDSSRCPVAAL